MPLLDVALSFALTMLFIAIAVTEIVQLIQKLAKTRNKVLQQMLKEYFEKKFEPAIKSEFNKLKMDANFTKGISDKLESTVKEVTDAKLFDEGELASLVEVSTEELTEKLKHSDFGEKLLENLGDKAQNVFDEIGHQYEVFGNKFTKMFRNKSKTLSIIVAFLLALLVNIDSVRIIDSYIKDESMRQSVIAQKDAIVDNYDALVTTLDDDNEKNDVTQEQLEQAFNSTQKQLDALMGSGFPIGWAYFPHSMLLGTKSANSQTNPGVVKWVTWVFGVLLTGLLAGQGAPFWYDIIAGLSRVTQKKRAEK